MTGGPPNPESQSSTADGRRAAFRRLLSREEMVVCPGVVNALFARLAERAGFELLYATGAGIANSHLGAPDLGLLTMSELLEIDRRIAESVSVPVLADIDTGYGGALNVYRTVREFTAAGVAGVQIEDQVNPKRCGHFADKEVVSRTEMLERILAAKEARADSGLVIVARTDALATEGVAEAITRANLCASAGADVIFVEAPSRPEDIALIPKEVAAPVLINMVEGGVTPLVGSEQLRQFGYKIVLYANALLRTALWAASQALATLGATGSTSSLTTGMLGWNERQALVGLDPLLELGRSIEEKARRAASAG